MTSTARMSRPNPRRGIRLRAIAAAVICAAALGGGASSAMAASGDTNLSTPILFVHGYDAFGSGVSCTMWNKSTQRVACGARSGDRGR